MRARTATAIEERLPDDSPARRYWAALDHEPECGAQRTRDVFGPDYHCTRVSGHDGPHMAHTPANKPVACWGDR